MASSNFIDYVKICSRSGKGGAGSVHFRREKHVPKGGPDGGDGGRGGHIIVRGNAQLWTLLHLKYTKHVIADPGAGGEGGRRTGANGEDVIVEVPLGTIARDAESGEQRFEITKDGQEEILTKGGKGGLGNHNFTTSTNQAPQHAQPGEPGIEEWIVLELKVLADVGLVGFPNAGKSTLLATISAAKPEIADYPFTTLTPNLGVVPYYDYQSFIMADIPGIIEGAAQGKGLGLRFLKHIERNALLFFVIPCDADDIAAQYEILKMELWQYNPELLHKKHIIGVSKVDIIGEELLPDLLKTAPKGVEVIPFSAATGYNLTYVKDRLFSLIRGALRPVQRQSFD